MSQKFLRILIALAALFLPTLGELFVQPAYQVAIMLEFEGREPINICNGCIIYERMIATTANCVHFKLSPKAKPTMLQPPALSVWAGSANGIRDVLKIGVSAIDVAAGFNIETLENDLALLTLSQPLLLGVRPDMQWIMLDDSEHVNNSCMVNSFLRNSRSDIPNYYQTMKLFLYNNTICRNSTAYPMARKADVCSLYVLPHQFSCEEAESFLSFNNDRGSGLVCKNYLVGILSSVLTRPDPKKNCSDVTLTAMYTNVFPHLMWIYSVMNNIETRFISTPYDGSFNPLVPEATLTENEIIAQVTPQDSALKPVNSTTASTSPTDGSLSKEGSLSWNETTVTPQSVSDNRDEFSATDATSSTANSGYITDEPATLIPPISENTTNAWNSTTISSTLATEETTRDPMNQLNLTTKTRLPTISSTFATETALAENLTTIRTTEDDAGNTSAPTLAVQLGSPAAVTIPSLVFTISSDETKQNEPMSTLTTEDIATISSTLATEAVTSEISTKTSISSTGETSLIQNTTTSEIATTASSSTTAGLILPTEGTARSLNSTTLDQPSFKSLTTSLVTDWPTETWNATTIIPSAFGANSTKYLNSTISPATETNSTTLPSPSTVQEATNESNFTETNFTADVSSEEDIFSWNDTTLLELNIIQTTTLDSVEDFSSTTISPFLKAFNARPTTSTAPSPTAARTKTNYTILWPLPTVQLEPLKESPQTSIGRLYRSSAAMRQLNASILLVAVVFLKLIFNH